MISHLLLLACALGCVWWIARTSEDHIMITMRATANDIERALRDLHELAANGEDSNARHAGQFLLALWDGDLNPLHLREFKYLEPHYMRQALQLFTFLMTTGTDLQKFMGAEAIDKVTDNLSAMNCDTFRARCNSSTRPAAPPAPAARTLR